jgi:hypothetical protein
MSIDRSSGPDCSHATDVRRACAAIDECVQRDVVRLADDALLELMTGVEGLRRRVDALAMRLLREIEVRGSSAGVGASNTRAWMIGALNQHPGAASRLLKLSEALHERYRGAAASLAAGRMTVDHAHVISRELDELVPLVPTSVIVEAEQTLVREAERFNPVELSKIARHMRAVLDPDGLAELERDLARQIDARELFLSRCNEGWYRLRARLDAESAALLGSAIDALAIPRPADAGGADVRTPARRRADALVDLVSVATRFGDLPVQAGHRPALTLTLDFDALVQRVAPATLDTGEPLSPADVRRIACDAGIIPVVLGGEGQPLDVGRLSYTVPTGLRRALVLRDRGCAFPGCGRPAGWTDAHHIQHWADGGPTALDNLVLLCGHHHRAVHHGGWDVRARPGARPDFRPPPWHAASRAVEPWHSPP